MLISEEEANNRINSPKNLANKIKTIDERGIEIRPILHGPKEGSERPNYTQEEKVLAAVIAHNLGDRVAIDAVGVSQASLTNWKSGQTGRRAQERLVQHPELKEAIESKLGIVRDKALDRLIESMGLIENGKLKNLNGLQLSTVSNNLAGVIQKLTPTGQNQSGNSVNVVLYAPNVKTVSDFKVVEV